MIQDNTKGRRDLLRQILLDMGTWGRGLKFQGIISQLASSSLSPASEATLSASSLGVSFGSIKKRPEVLWG